MARVLVFAFVSALVSAPALAAPKGAPLASPHYEGARLAFTVPAGMKVADATDIIADYALDLVPQPGSALANVSLRLLLSDKTVSDADGDALAKTWRSARVRNRASWGVKKSGDVRNESVQIGGHRFVRFVDEMGSRLGPARQIMLCGSVQGRLLCGVANASGADEKAAETTLTGVLSGVSLRKAR
jgi:hypothetical protein